MSDIHQPNDTNAHASPRSQMRYISWIIIALFIGIVLVIYMVIKNGVHTEAQKVNERWTTVTIAYQHRTDLIPKLLQIADSSNITQQAAVEELKQLQYELGNSKATPKTHFLQQDRVMRLVNTIIIELQNIHGKRNSAFLDIEQAINRSESQISIERKYYNDAVAAYNAYIERFPRNLFGFPTKEQLKSSDITPEIYFQF